MFCPVCGTSVTEGSAFCPSCGSRVPVASQPNQPAPVQSAAAPAYYPPAMNYASWGARAVGYIIDTLLVGALMVVLYLPLAGVLAGISGALSNDFNSGGVGAGWGGAGAGICCIAIVLFPLASLLIGFYNRVYLISSRGYSIGQGVVSIKVVDANGRLLSLGTTVIRLLAQVAMAVVPLLPILDLLWPLWDERRQTLHDKAVNCYVVDNPGA